MDDTIHTGPVDGDALLLISIPHPSGLQFRGLHAWHVPVANNAERDEGVDYLAPGTSGAIHLPSTAQLLHQVMLQNMKIEETRNPGPIQNANATCRFRLA
ncbi:hypothetical protein C1O66_07475 [Paucibacter aquatile]|uniref:Uncharacterized protein n=1 Tax=Kinneretia aquatilis TaxID=2070761 RepID=A0A2N8KVA7_9BURK|nr:hypothetical protein C1O66_07475 [Paucibacter aquatile]